MATNFQGSSHRPRAMGFRLRNRKGFIYEDRSADFHFYIDKFDELFQRFGYCFIAIQKKKILGTFKSWGEAIHETEKVYPRGTFIVQECSDDRNVYTVTICSPISVA